jgi:formiminotetrahydrofolate cyclodeaminase
MTIGGVSALTVGDLLDLLAADASGPAAGSAAALTAGAAASVVAMAARRSSGSWPEGNGVAAQAAARRRRCLELVAADADALAAAQEALEGGHPLAAPLRGTVQVLLDLAAAASDIADLAAVTAERCDGAVRADAAAAASLAQAAVEVAATLVRANLTVTSGDEALVRVERLRLDAVAAAARAREVQ